MEMILHPGRCSRQEETKPDWERARIWSRDFWLDNPNKYEDDDKNIFGFQFAAGNGSCQQAFKIPPDNILAACGGAHELKHRCVGIGRRLQFAGSA